MKKFSFICIIMALLVFAACGGSSKNENKDEKSDSEEAVTDEDSDKTDTSSDTGVMNGDDDVDYTSEQPDTGDSTPDCDIGTIPSENDDDTGSEPCTQDKCGDWCGDFQSDKAHCGNCDTPCEEFEDCKEGKCVAFDCSEEKIKCFCNNSAGGICSGAETSDHELHCIDSSAPQTCGASDCGHLGKQCMPGQTCVKGACVCPDSLLQDPATGECLDPKSDDSCGVTSETVSDSSKYIKCGADEYCDGSDCVCNPGYKRCGGECVKILNDINHCGECDNKCGEHATCVEGICKCDNMYAICPGRETEGCITPNFRNCCGYKTTDSITDDVNSPAETCDTLHSCEISGNNWKCKCDTQVIDGKCIDPDTDNEHCGEELKNCNDITGSQCKSGVCVCKEGERIKTVDGVSKCVDVLNDPSCCGNSCKKCENTQACTGGDCHNTCESGFVKCKGRCLKKIEYFVTHVIHDGVESEDECECTINSSNAQACPDNGNNPNLGCRSAELGDDNNCSACGDKCPDGYSCISNQCRCRYGEQECSYQPNEFSGIASAYIYCIDGAKADELHLSYNEFEEIMCKSCKQDAANHEIWENVDNDWRNGCEVNLSDSREYCGTTKENAVNCSNKLKHVYGADCDNSKCIFEDCNSAEYRDCNNDSILAPADVDGCETDIQNDDSHCGKCGNACPDGAYCSGGSCCYKNYTDIEADLTQFQCCSGDTLYEYKPSFAFPFCWESPHYACTKENLDVDACWLKVK